MLNSEDCLSTFAKIRHELHRSIVGQDALIDRLLVALISDGHILLEGVPGLAKTRLLTTLTSAVQCKMNRVQFTPDLLPADLVGTEVYQPQQGTFSTRKGPIFTNLLLADEINRAPAKVQSALLQAMQEREVTIGEETLKLPSPFMVLATQNPIEQEGTYPLPEAQVDRFLMKVKVSYPTYDDELRILELVTNSDYLSKVESVISISDLLELRRSAQEIYVDPKIDRYIVSLVQASRSADSYGLKGMIEWGASPRASIALKLCAKGLALLRGKGFVTPDDVKDLSLDILRHRIIPSFEAQARGITSDEIVTTLLKNIAIP